MRAARAAAALFAILLLQGLDQPAGAAERRVPDGEYGSAAPTGFSASRESRWQSRASRPATVTIQADSARAAGSLLARSRAPLETPLLERLTSVLGTALLVLFGWLLSVNRRAIDWRLVGYGIALQVVFAVLVLKTTPGQLFFSVVNDTFVKLLGFTREGARFLFGNLVDPNVPVGRPAGDPASAPIPGAGVTAWAHTGAFFAFSVLPTIIFFSSLMAVLYHLGVLQRLVALFAWVMRRSLRTSGAETLSASANIFVGMTEAPLMIRPFVSRMTRSELMCVMTGGFATVAGGVMAAYVGLLSPWFPDIAGHLLAASIMSAPAAIVFAKLMVPETDEPVTRGAGRIEVPSPDVNLIDTATRGAGEGLHLALNVGAMLLAFIALIALLDAGVGWVGSLARVPGLTLEGILGWLLAPLALAMGVPPRDAVEVGALLGIKTVLNEFVAYLRLADDLARGTGLEPRSVIIATYALCGFSNLASIAIQIGGIGGMAPERRSELSQLGLRAMIAGSLACFMTATIAGSIL